jgi:hypothetical protein
MHWHLFFNTDLPPRGSIDATPGSAVPEGEIPHLAPVVFATITKELGPMANFAYCEHVLSEICNPSLPVNRQQQFCGV